MTKKLHLLVAPISIIAMVMAFVLLLSMSVVPITHAASSTVTLYTKAPTVSVVNGSNFSVQIRLLKSTTDWVNYVSAYVSYNPAMVSIVSTSKSGSVFTDDGGPTIRYSNTNGSLTVVGISEEYVPTPSDSLVATITFQAKKSGKTTISMSSQSQAGRLVGQTNVKDYLMSTAGTSVSISNPPVVAPPATSVPPSVAPTDTMDTDEKVEKDTSVESPQITKIEPDVTDEQVVVPLAQEPAVAEETDEASGRNWFTLLAGGVVLLVAVAGAVFAGRRYIASQRMEERILRNIFALGGTAHYAAEYIEPERLGRRVFETPHVVQPDDSEEIGRSSVVEADATPESEVEIAEVLQPNTSEHEAQTATPAASVVDGSTPENVGMSADVPLPPKPSMYHLIVPSRRNRENKNRRDIKP